LSASEPSETIRLAVVDDHPLVTAGVAAMLEPYRARIQVTEYVGQIPAKGAADVVLLDPYSTPDVNRHMDQILASTGAPVVVFTWAETRGLAEHALQLGAIGVLSKTAEAVQIVTAVENAHAGRPMRSALETRGSTTEWPGQPEGLTARESEVVSLIAAGLMNHEIASALYLSTNSVKSYIRSAYRKMGVHRRSEAVLWALKHGFQPHGGPPAID
jgi:DNA-binding NarL/FixJ family response regulator